jgi:hypothetical protein
MSEGTWADSSGAQILTEAFQKMPPFGTSVDDIANTLSQVSELTSEPQPKPFLNLGCGTIILPAPRPEHHALVDNDIYEGQAWYNVDKVANAGVDQVFDLFTYPWPLADNSFSGALASHLCEHIGHEIKIAPASGYWLASIPEYVVNWYNKEWNSGGVPAVAVPDFDDFDEYQRYTDRVDFLENLQDSWFCFFSELSRVLEPGAIVHLLSPYGQSTDAMIDPTHTRFLFPHTFQYFMPNPDAPFQYNLGSEWEIVGQPTLGLSARFQHLAERPDLMQEAMEIYFNVAKEFYIRLRNVK